MSFAFDQSSFIEAVRANRIRWQAHAIERRLDRGIAPESILQALIDFDVIELYPDSYPLPSLLLMGMNDGKAIHVAAAYNSQTRTIFVITVYFPDEKRFEPDFRTRRRNN